MHTALLAHHARIETNLPAALPVQTGDPHATLDRLFDSRHVKDLRLIIRAALAVVLLLSAGCVAALWRKDATWTSIGAFITPVLTVFGAVLAWAYQVGSARLGVVDLFACEISTLCRVAAVVGSVRRSVDMFNQGPSPKPAGLHIPLAHPFTSQENYFPVFESSTRDLQAMEAMVVINITAFYAFMEAVRDSLRALAEMSPQPADSASRFDRAPAAGSWHEAARNVVYLLFLGFESARHAIADLVEFEPEKAERTILVLFSELEAYRFLRSQFTDEEDVYHQRIMLREPEYRELVPDLCRAVMTGKASNPERWEPACLLLPELRRRFQDAVSV